MESSSSKVASFDDLPSDSSSSSDDDEHDPKQIVRWLDQALQRERQAMQHILKLRHRALLKSLGPRLSHAPSKSHSKTVVKGKVRERPWNNIQNLAPIPEEMVFSRECEPQLAVPKYCNGEDRLRVAGATVTSLKQGVDCLAGSRSAFLSGEKTWHARFAERVNGPVFELAFSVIIIINAVIMALEMQYRGFDSGRATDYPGCSLHAVELWPWASEFFFIAEWVLLVSFTVELLLKMVAQRRRFLDDMWNLVDCLIFAAWIVQTILQADVGINPILLRLVRLLRLLRLLRVFGTIAVFDSLHLLMTAIRHNCALIVWSLLVLILIQMCLAMLLQSLLEEYVRDPTNENTLEVYKHFGSFSRALLTMFDMTLGNWMPACRVLVENVSEWYSIFFLMHKFLIGFSVVSIITAVFIQETFRVVASDETIVLNNQERLIKIHEEKMSKLFYHADEDGVGVLGRSKFTKIMGDPVVQQWLASFGLQKEDAGLVFDMLNSSTGKQTFTASELVKGGASLKGSARHIDLVALVTYYKQSHNLLKQLSEQLMFLDLVEEEEETPARPPRTPRGDHSVELAEA